MSTRIDRLMNGGNLPVLSIAGFQVELSRPHIEQYP
jgi:hypothetical protein